MSRLRSGRGASTAGARPAAQRGVYVQSPRSDIYVALLGVALGAMLLGCLLLLLVWNRYGLSTKVAGLSQTADIQTYASADFSPLQKVITVRL
ncbi:MAG: hypothetical protein NVSMB9_20010 [Isosphaeraceae bacterium]